MKSPKLYIALAVLLAALAGFLGAVAAERWFAPTQPGSLHEFVHEQLDLTAQQEDRLDRLEERYAIENAQRDINIAFINEITEIFHKLGISTHDVLEAAGTKWNFLPFKPGLVGGHCIGVDP